jgi:hypothetical protein
MTPRAARAHTFADTYFAGCPAHRREARATFEALEQIAARVLLVVDADLTVEAVLWSHGRTPPVDSLDVIEAQMALEEEDGDPTRVQESLGVARSEHVLRTLLGPAAQQSTWEPETIWLRSIRGVVNERVRHREGCTCADAGTPSNKQMQRTRPAQAMEPRR